MNKDLLLRPIPDVFFFEPWEQEGLWGQFSLFQQKNPALFFHSQHSGFDGGFFVLPRHQGFLWCPQTLGLCGPYILFSATGADKRKRHPPGYVKKQPVFTGYRPSFTQTASPGYVNGYVLSQSTKKRATNPILNIWNGKRGRQGVGHSTDLFVGSFWGL